MSVRRPPDDQRLILSNADLTAVWGSVISGEPLRERALWLLFIDDVRRPVGPVVTIDALPDGPYDVPTGDLVGICRELIDGPGAAASVAFLMTRPGSVPWTVSDRAWGRFLTASAALLGGTVWPVHWGHRRALERFVLHRRAG